MGEILLDFFGKLLDTSDFPARWHCGEWSAFHGWLYISASLLIWLAYFTIPIPLVLLYFWLKKSTDLPFRSIIPWFIAFILFCGFTHLLDALILWEPLYRLNALALAGTAVVSLGTVVKMTQFFPRVMDYKSPETLQRIVNEQTKALEEQTQALEEQAQALQEANQKLADSEARFKSLINQNPDAIVEFDRNLRHIFVNDSVAQLTDSPPDFFVGKTPTELGYPPELTSRYEEYVAQAFASGGTIHYEAKGLDNQDFMGSAVPLKNEVGQVTSVINVARDISAQKHAERTLRENYEQLQQLSENLSVKNQQLENFAYIVSHNLRAPMANLQTLYALYLQETDPAEHAFLVEKGGEVIAKLDQTIQDLTEVVKIRQDTAIPRTLISFDELMYDVQQLLALQIEETQAEIVCDFSACTHILYPKAYLDSILYNLVSNALKYRAPLRAPVVQLRTQWKEGRILLTCQDNGLGIDLARYGAKVFGLNQTFHTNEDARGVGLFMTKNQIEALGGSISVSSKVGEGTRFELWFDPAAGHHYLGAT